MEDFSFYQMYQFRKIFTRNYGDALESEYGFIILHSERLFVLVKEIIF